MKIIIFIFQIYKSLKNNLLNEENNVSISGGSHLFKNYFSIFAKNQG